ncbi:MAG: hypothetical protein ACKOCD_03330 [Nitrospiraceae bacterium]
MKGKEAMPEYQSYEEGGIIYSIYPRQKGAKWVCEFVIESFSKHKRGAERVNPADYLINHRELIDGTFDSREDAQSAGRNAVKDWVKRSIL